MEIPPEEETELLADLDVGPPENGDMEAVYANGTSAPPRPEYTPGAASAVTSWNTCPRPRNSAYTGQPPPHLPPTSTGWNSAVTCGLGGGSMTRPRVTSV